jgi:hypothetical protein
VDLYLFKVSEVIYTPSRLIRAKAKWSVFDTLIHERQAVKWEARKTFLTHIDQQEASKIQNKQETYPPASQSQNAPNIAITI